MAIHAQGGMWCTDGPDRLPHALPISRYVMTFLGYPKTSWRPVLRKRIFATRWLFSCDRRN
jgi:hypothetical protein